MSLWKPPYPGHHDLLLLLVLLFFSAHTQCLLIVAPFPSLTPLLALWTYSGAHMQVPSHIHVSLVFWPEFNQFDWVSSWLHWCCDTHKAAFCSSSAFQLLPSLHPPSLFSELWRGGGMNVLLRAEWSTITNAQYLSGHKSLHLLHFTIEFLWLRLREQRLWTQPQVFRSSCCTVRLAKQR